MSERKGKVIELLEGELKNVIEEIVNDLEGERNKSKMPIGVISEELNNSYVNWLSENEDLEEEIKVKMKIEKAKLERRLAEEFEERFINKRQEQKKLWKDIRKELNIDSEEEIELNIDTKTGVISQWIKGHEQTH